MEILFLGTGTSHGVPLIGCSCATCLSTNPRNKRLRTSVLVTVQGKKILIDTSTDFRQQCLRYHIDQIDGILFTHHHADHIFGLDDTRVFNKIQKKRMMCYGSPATIAKLRHVYSYVFEYPDIPGGIPMIEFIAVNDRFDLFGIPIVPIEIMHGSLPVFAYRIGDFIYATDCNSIPEQSRAKFAGADVIVLDCLGFDAHPTHFSLDQAIEMAIRLKAKQTYFTHMAHRIEHEAVSKMLPSNIALAYDGLQIDL
jgi:phosphoribosyl 1,2-cyclic phosphate phosphodiesterase